MRQSELIASSEIIKLAEGRYVVAVSGGVDSVVLLNLLLEKPGLDLVVAHIDHGIRPNSAQDRKFVEKLAMDRGLEFNYRNVFLGQSASEELARKARHKYLHEIKTKHHSQAIIMAHHQDDVIETAILNLIRGTGRSGLSSLKSRPDVIRPLLNLSKKQIIKYAQQNAIAWVEDETNKSTNYLRNYIRHKIITRFNEQDRAKFVELLNQASQLNDDLDDLLTVLLEKLGDRKGYIKRGAFINLEHSSAKEILRAWLIKNSVRDLSARNIEDLTVLAKTLKDGKSTNVKDDISIFINKNKICLMRGGRPIK